MDKHVVDGERYSEELIETLQLAARTHGGKGILLSTVTEQTGVSFPKSMSYRNILKKVTKDELEQEFCQAIFNADNFEVVVSRFAVASGLSLLSRKEIFEVADYLSADQHTWKYDRSSATKAILAIEEKECLEEVNQCLSTLMSTGRIELLTRQNKKWVVGPFGISQAVEYRKAGQVWGLRTLINEELSNNLLGDFIHHAGWIPSGINLSKDANDECRRQEFIQIVLSNGTNTNILSIFNKLIDDGILDIKTIRTYEFTVVGTPCGVFEKQYNGVNRLAELLISTCPLEQLRTQLSQKGYFSSEIRLGAIELCIRENPISILNEFFGWADLMKLAKDLDFVRIDKVPKYQLAEVIAVRLGFELPVPIEGIAKAIDRVEKGFLSLSESIHSKEELDGIMSAVYRNIEVVLKDLIRFYTGFLWPESSIEEEPGERREIFNRFCRGKFNINKADGIDGLTLGELLQVLHKLNAITKEETILQDKLHSEFHRRIVVSSKLLAKVEESLKARRYVAHDKGEAVERKEVILKCYTEALGKTKEFLLRLKQDDIYPKVIRVKKEVTDEFGRRYVEAIDEDEKSWLVHSEKYLWSNESYFMHSVTSSIAVDPYLSPRFR